MSYNKINIGQQANDGTGDSIRTAFTKADAMFQELYGLANGGVGISFTNFYDTPKKLIASSTSTATILAVDLFGNTVTQKFLVGGSGIQITNSATSNKIVISAPIASIGSDPNPKLAANLNGQGHIATNFGDPVLPTDLATKEYVDTNSPYSVVNFYVSTNGYATFPSNIPADRHGRSLAYAFRHLNDAAAAAEAVIESSAGVLSSYEQYLTLNNGNTTATIFATISSPSIPNATRILIDYLGNGASGTDQYLAQPSPNIRPGQYLQGAYSGSLGFVETFGHAPSIGISNYNPTTCYRDVGLIVDAIAQDLLYPTSGNSQSTFAGIQYYAQSTSTNSIIPGEYTTTTIATIYLQSLAEKIVTGNTTGPRYQSAVSQITTAPLGSASEVAFVQQDFQTIVNILNTGTTGITDFIVPNSLTSSTTATTIAAYNLLLENIPYMQAEVNAYITATNSSYVYDSVKCARDVSYMVTSVAFDLLYGGNRQAVQAGAYYYGYTTATIVPNEGPEVIAAYNHISSIVGNIITGQSVTPLQSAVTQVTTGPVGTSAQTSVAQTIISTITNIIQNGPGVAAAPMPISINSSTTAAVYNAARLLEANRSFIQAETIAFINQSVTTYEYYDVIVQGNGFIPNEPLLFAYEIPKPQVSILIESGVYEEQYPIRLSANVSLRGDELRRVIIKPASGVSQSPWTKLFFRRDSSFDGLTYNSPENAGNGLARPGYEYGYHYLTDPTDPTSTPKLNSDMDVFLVNDTVRIQAVTAQGHGGFMCVFDPEGQILTKSPYFSNDTSFSFSINKQKFAGGLYVDGFAGNLEITPASSAAGVYYVGTTTLKVASPSNTSGLYVRQPQVPVSFYVNGNRYQVVYITDYNSTNGTATLNLNPYDAGGIAFPNGIITIPQGQGGKGYSTPPTVVFSPPDQSGGYTAQGTATINSFGTLTSIVITNPGTGYVNSATINLVGGNPVTYANTVTINTSSIAAGFIGVLPSFIELNTPGNKSMLGSDFTQMNDLGYGIVATNNGIVEAVSLFTYYNHTGYYARNGGSIRSLNGSCAFGDYALKAEGSDPNEVPIPVSLQVDMVQTATIVSNNWYVSGIANTVNTVNTAGSTTLFIRNPYTVTGGYATPDMSYYTNSVVEVDYGQVTNSTGSPLGIQTFNVVNANTVSNLITNPQGYLVQLNLASSLVGGIGGLPAPISSGTAVTIRSGQQFILSGVRTANLIDPNLTALVFAESSSTAYPVAAITDLNAKSAISDLNLQSPFNYLSLSTWNSSTYRASAGATSMQIVPLNTTTGDGARLLKNLSGTPNQYTEYTFAWDGTIHRITGYTYTLGQGSLAYDTITFTPALVSTVTNYGTSNPYGNITLNAGLRAGAPGSLYSRISTMRATGADLFNIGTGGYLESRYPNDIYGPSVNKPNAAHERTSVGQGRVFAITTDQDGNFRVGDFFNINQASGSVTIAANIGLSKVSSLSFAKGGWSVDTFDYDDTLSAADPHAVPVETAVIGYINHRLGLDQNGVESGVTKIGPGYLDLTGVQDMTGNVTLNGNNINMGPRSAVRSGITGTIINLTTTSVGGNVLDAVNKGYADTKLSLAGTNAIDSTTGVNNANSQGFGIMTGPLILYGDPQAGDHGSKAVSKRYADKRLQLAALPDVALTNPYDLDLLMFTNQMAVVNTTTNNPIWTASCCAVNVKNNTNASANTNLANGGGSDVYFTRNANTLTIKISGGLGTANPITDYHVNTNACIQQSKLCMCPAITCSTCSPTYNQSCLGLASFDSKYFTSCSGWISPVTPSPLLVCCACQTCFTLTAGSYICASAGGTTFNGCCAATWTLCACTANSNCTVVVRDSTGNSCFNCLCATANVLAACVCASNTICAPTICASTAICAPTVNATTVCGTTMCATTFCGCFCGCSSTSNLASCANKLCISANCYISACTASSACTIVARDGSCNISANCFSGCAVCAFYADLAEKYSSDQTYAPCTVLEFGGSCEVTMAEDGTNRVAGVVSTNPAYAMNSGLESEFTAMIALQGRVPCKVRGKISKGDMLVSAGGGYARACRNPSIGTVIGKALEDFNGIEGVIEVVVGRL